MSKKIRDGLFYLFVLLFIVGTVLISLYASGYKFNLSWPLRYNRLLIKTGMIAVDTLPRGAAIYLNDEPQSNLSLNPFGQEYLTTAAKIKNVLPGEYNLRLEREGYWPFQKKINVYSGQTTFTENINLFRNDKPLLLQASSETEAVLSPSHKYLYVPATRAMITLKNNETRTLPASDSPASWLAASDRILSGGNIYGPTAAEDIDYEHLIGAEATDWRLDEANGRLYYQNNNSLGYLKLSDKASALAVSGQIINTYEPRGDNIFFVTTGGGRVAVKRYSFSSQKTEDELNLPTVGKYEFHNDGVKLLVLYDNLNKTLHLLNPDNLQNGSQTINNIISWQWIDDNTLLYNNNWEIYRLDLKTGKSNLLTRVGEEITKLIWNGDSEYLIFASATTLNALDMRINASTKFFQADKIAGASLDGKSNIIYFWARQGAETGVYKMIMQ